MLTVILTLRWASFVLACWNLRWSARGMRQMAHGRWTPPAIYLSVVFLFALVVVSFWAAWMFGATPAWRLLSYVLLTLTMGLAAYGHIQGAAMKASRFYALYDHLEPAYAIATLAHVDPAAADRMADECRRLTAAAVLEPVA